MARYRVAHDGYEAPGVRAWSLRELGRDLGGSFEGRISYRDGSLEVCFFVFFVVFGSSVSLAVLSRIPGTKVVYPDQTCESLQRGCWKRRCKQKNGKDQKKRSRKAKKRVFKACVL